MRDEASLIGRMRTLPRKVGERGLGWALRRAREVAWSGVCSTMYMGELAIIRALVRYFPYVRSFAQNTLVVTYDLEAYPISYDFCWFLVWADFDRRHRELKNLHCIFLPIEHHDTRVFPPGYDAIVDRTSREWRFQNICLATVQLLPGCNGVTICTTRGQINGLNLLLERERFNRGNVYRSAPLSAIYRDLTARAASTPGDWGLAAPEQGLRYVAQWISGLAKERKLVVVTLRQYAVDVERNSRTEDWVTFLKRLNRTGYFPVIVPDTDHALEMQDDLGDIALFNEAAWNLGIRMALYERAYMNMLVNCGPASLCILNPRTRYMLFKITVPGVHLASEATLREMGFEPGKQPPFAGPFQRWIWEEDRLDVITREFNAMVERIGQDGRGSAAAPTPAS